MSVEVGEGTGRPVGPSVGEEEGDAKHTVVDGGDEYSDTVGQSIRDIRDLIETSSVDEQTKASLRTQLDEYEKTAEEAATGLLEEQLRECEQRREQQRLRFEQEQEVLRTELASKKAERWTQTIVRLLDRDLVSVLIGGILLIVICIALIWMIAHGMVEARLLESAFLILLGFFFGQGIARPGRTASPNAESDK
jgi:DNA-binding transcriptional MerR regulator